MFNKNSPNLRRNNGIVKFNDGKFIIYINDTLIPVHYSLGCGRVGKASVGFFFNGDRLGVYIEQIGSQVENLLTHAEEVIAVTMNSFACDVPLSMCDFFFTTTVIAKKRRESFVFARVCERQELKFNELTYDTEKKVRCFVDTLKGINIPIKRY